MPVSLSEGRAAAERKDRPIIFSGPMVRALLEGRKTQTRRVLTAGTATVNGYAYRTKEPAWAGLRLSEATARTKSPWTGLPNPHLDVPWEHPEDAARGVNSETVYRVRPRIEAGDRLWVKEVVAAGACAPSKPSEWSPSFWRREQSTPANPNGLWYAADDLVPERTITTRGRWVSPIFMPRWASRLTLIVESVKVERLQDISEEDAVAEGIGFWHQSEAVLDNDRMCNRWCQRSVQVALRRGEPRPTAATNVGAYALFWEVLHGKAAWDANPWVAILTFRPIPQNIDSLGASA